MYILLWVLYKVAELLYHLNLSNYMVFINNPTKKIMKVNQRTETLTHGIYHTNFHFPEKSCPLFLKILPSEFREKFIYAC